MKKILGFALLSVVLLTGCTGNNSSSSEPSGEEGEKVSLYYKDETLTGITEFADETALTDFESKLQNKENFIMVSYADSSCSCWNNFKLYILNPFVINTGIPVFAIHTDLLEGNYHGLKINSAKTNTPVLGIYEKGKYKFGTSYSADKDVFINSKTFNDYIDHYTTRPLMAYISLEKLNTLLKGTSPFIINWSYNLCPDCKVFDNTFIKDYLKSGFQTKVPYYLIESAKLRNKDDASLWNNIKDTYGLSNTKNTEYGYLTGFVPTLQYIEPNGTDYVVLKDISPIISDMLVFQNDQLNEGKTLITDSFFNGERGKTYLGTYQTLIGKALSSDREKRSEEIYALHAPLATSFLNHYWKK